MLQFRVGVVEPQINAVEFQMRPELQAHEVREVGDPFELLTIVQLYWQSRMFQ